MINNKKLEGPYSIDKVFYNHKGKKTTSILNSSRYESIIKDINIIYKYDVASVPASMKNRPDLLANYYYGDPSNWWLIMFINNINDPFESLNPNQKIAFPKIK
jgi:hypothetical protein